MKRERERGRGERDERREKGKEGVIKIIEEGKRKYMYVHKKLEVSYEKLLREFSTPTQTY